MMNAKNITATIVAATFSARRRSQAPASRIMRAPLLERVDLFEHALGPLLGLVGSQVNFLSMRAERGDVRGVDLEAVLLAESLRQFRFAFQVLIGAPFERLVDRGLRRLLLARREGVPQLQVHT